MYTKVRRIVSVTPAQTMRYFVLVSQNALDILEPVSNI